MEKLLRDITNELYELNDLFGKKALSEKDIIQEEKNYFYFLQMQEKLVALLPELQKSSFQDKSEYTKNMLELYQLARGFREYYEDMHDTLCKVMSQVYKQLRVSDDAQH